MKDWNQATMNNIFFGFKPYSIYTHIYAFPSIGLAPYGQPQ